MALNLTPNVANADDMYQVIIDMHDGLSDEASARVNAKMILLLANHIGDIQIIEEAARLARGDTDSAT